MNKRIKGIIVNISIIISLLCLFYYFSDYYISINTCRNDMLKAYNSDDFDILHVVENKNNVRYVLTDNQYDTWSILNISKKGLLYTPEASQYNLKINKEKAFDVNVYFDTEFEHTIMIYRNNKDIDHIKITIKDHNVIEEKTWNNDFIFTSYKSDTLGKKNIGVYEAFDKNGKLIESIQY